jgi:hypothetical protein
LAHFNWLHHSVVAWPELPQLKGYNRRQSWLHVFGLRQL